MTSNQPEIVVCDSHVHVATVIMMEVIAIYLDEATVRLGRDDPFQVYSVLCAERLVSRVSQTCALWQCGWASRMRSTFPWW